VTDSAPLLTFILPWPPTANNLYATGRSRKGAARRFLSTRGKAYAWAVAAVVASQAPRRRPLSGRLAVTIAALPPDKRVRDLDNLCKAVLDSLKKSGVFADDGQIDSLTIARHAVTPGGALLVGVREFEL